MHDQACKSTPCLVRGLAIIKHESLQLNDEMDLVSVHLMDVASL